MVPALDAARTIGAVVRAARAQLDRVVVVDDGSTDATAAIARECGATVVAHVVNRGKGAALRTGLEWAREEVGGNVYAWRERDLEGWLCPALLRYFPEAPERISRLRVWALSAS